jgi:hypothetical protein
LDAYNKKVIWRREMAAYIFEHKRKPGVFSAGYDQDINKIATTTLLKRAIVFEGRANARECKLAGEVLRQVRLNRYGQPVKIIATHC